MTTRRDVLLAGAALPIAAVVVSASLTYDELRVLAMCATPRGVWEGREEEYLEQRCDRISKKERQIARSLALRGLVVHREEPVLGMTGFFEATETGLDVLRKVGVEVALPS